MHHALTECCKGRFSHPGLLFSLFTKDRPKSLRCEETYLYADDTTINCIAETMDLLTNTLNNVLAELRNFMVPHPENCKAMIMQRKSTFTGPIQALRLGNNIIKWTTSERLLGVQVDNKLSWSDHAANIAKSFASKLSLLRRMPFLSRKAIRHKSDTAINYIRFDSVGIVQQDSHKHPGQNPCKGWTNCMWVAMGH